MPDKCERCDEKIEPVSLSKDWPSRLRGRVTVRTHRVTWISIRFGNTPSLESPRITNSELDLCDGCWGELLAWATQPEQARLRIAAENRRNKERVVEVAEARREREISRLMEVPADAQ